MIKKFTLIFVTLACTKSLFSQPILNPISTDIWTAVEIKLNNKEKLDLISQIKFSNIRLTPSDGTSNLELFHILDINNDGLLDISYSGPKAEGEGTVFYLNNGDTFLESDWIHGKVININRLEISKLLEVQTYAMPCCAGFVYALKTVLLKSNIHTGIEIIELDELNYMSGTLEPNNLITTQRFTTVNQEYKLRSSPEINPQADIWTENIDGNTVAIYPSGSRGTAIGQKSDETGRIWWFVIMENNLQPDKSLMYYQNDPKGNKSMGWMSSKYVKKIN